METAFERLVLLAAIAQAAWAGGTRRRIRLAASLPAMLFSVLRAGWLGYLGFVLTVALSGKELSKRPLSALAASLVLTTAVTHAVFFGAGRYGFVCAGLLCVACVGATERRRSTVDPPSSAGSRSGRRDTADATESGQGPLSAT